MSDWGLLVAHVLQEVLSVGGSKSDQVGLVPESTNASSKGIDWIGSNRLKGNWCGSRPENETSKPVAQDL